jgi:pimeloyl-ACP methyl ester carboxylesterase
MATNPASAANYLDRPEGRIAYDIDGTGPLVVLVPGMGDLRGAYRFLAPALRDAGYGVACTDLRGHGDSDTTFSSYGDVDTAGDVIALLEALGAPAIVVGDSMAAGSGVLVAAQRPLLVAGLVLIGPFVRDPKTDMFHKIMLRAAMARPWAATAWKAYLPKLYAGRRPADFDDYRNQVIPGIRRRGHTKAFCFTTRNSHAPAEARLGDVTAPTLVIMGEQDPDFADPGAEADWIAEAVHGQDLMVPDAGHCPQSQRADITTPAVIHFVDTVNHRA